MSANDPRPEAAASPFGRLNNPSGWYRHYCLALIFLVLVIAYVDRGIFGVVLEPIKAEFGLSDLQLGLLTGPAFALFYAVMGIPLARWADMGNRRIVISLCMAIWSAMTALGGLAQNYFMLFLTRVGVGIGEAGAMPPTHSLASGYYPTQHHGKVASLLSFAALLGSFAGVIVGGMILAATDWRTTLMAIGLPGLALAVIAFYTLREPRQVTRVPGLSEIFDRESRGVVARLFSKPTYLQLAIAFAVISFFTLGMPAFLIPFFQRSFELDVEMATRYYGVTALISTVLGTILAGALVDRMARRNLAWKLRLPGVLCLVAAPIMAVGLLSESAKQCLLFYGLANTLVFMALPALYSAVYGVSLDSERAMALAVLGLITNLIGLGFGPVVIGGLSDWLNPRFGIESLRYALALSVVFLGWASIHMLIGSRTLAQDFATSSEAPQRDPLPASDGGS